ncbi:MAG TPA: leishmanolysin-related zinc metalloendopeptidase [Gemmatimonadales bacterium]|nr:leishmanolysin-related zinc metalloendopeptidase [Gemmatimonadales bacterium]
MSLRSRLLFVLPVALVACKGSEAFVATPTTISLSLHAMAFGAIGSQQQLAATVLDQRGDPIPSASIVWSSDNPLVADVSAGGLATAFAVGSTKLRGTVTLTQGSIVDSATVSVTQVPAHFLKFAGDNQIDTVSGTLPTAITVQVTDTTAHPISQIIVAFAVTSGGGHVSSAADTTDATGRASVQWTLGSAVGPNVMTATAAVAIPGSPATFSASGVLAGSAPSVAINNGNGQHGLIGAPLNFPPSVVVADGAGTPIAGKQVTFAVSGGAGVLSGGTAVTDANGIATVGSWTVGAGANALTATVADTGTVVGNPVTFTATGDPQAYHIDVRFITTMTPTQQAAFTSAAAKWESIIFGDVPDIQITIPPGSCGTGSPGLNEIVDDVVIFAIIDSIDGPGKILGQAGPCFVRNLKHIPVLGVMQFDSADVATLIAGGSFGLVIQHEMGHVLGYGTIWQSDGLLANPSGCDTTIDAHFTGSQALAAFDRIGGANYVASAKVPVENHGGPGTCDAHWRESVFKNELMTGFLNIGSNPLSLETVGSMGDLGYLVTYSAADSYSLLTMALRVETSQAIIMRNDVMQLPIRVLDPSGRVVGTLPPRR